MELDATSISDFQACPRRYLLNLEWKPHRWRPRTLFMATLRAGILSISNGASVEDSAAESVARFMQTAVNPGLDVLGDPYLIAKEWTSLLSSVLHTIAREIPTKLSMPPIVKVNSFLDWSPTAFIADGRLHRWITTDSWSPSDLPRELHSWWVLGDVCVLNLPLTLHILSIGSMRNGRRSSPFTRAWRHPGLVNLPMRFKRKDGKEFEGWKPVYLSDNKVSVESWTAQLIREGVTSDIIHNIPVNVPNDTQRSIVMRDILLESVRIRELTGGWMDQPMSRNACDGHVPCAFQDACYSSSPIIDISTLGLYRSREEKYALSGSK